MWTKSKSAALSLICTRVLICAAVAIAVALPFLISGYYLDIISAGRAFSYEGRFLAFIFSGLPQMTVIAIYACAYASFGFAMVALLALDKLLRNIRKDIVFVRGNVRCLRIISWCCFAIAIIMICSWPQIHYSLTFVAAAAAFFGLLMRVFKNIIETACEIKDENDFTI